MNFGHPDNFVYETLPKSALLRVFRYAQQFCKLHADPRDLTFKSIYQLDKDELINCAKGKGVTKDHVSNFSEALNNTYLWYLDPGQRVPFCNEKNKMFTSRKTPHEMNMVLVNEDLENDVGINIKSKHLLSLEIILKESSHPSAKEILSSIGDELSAAKGIVINTNNEHIDWKESVGGYSFVYKRIYGIPLTDVYGRWDAIVLGKHVSLIQVENDLSILNEEMEVYINLDSRPELLCSTGVDIDLANEHIIEVLKNRFPELRNKRTSQEKIDQK